MTDQKAPVEPEFRPSSFSGGGNCVEVRQVPGQGPVTLRNSRLPGQPLLAFNAKEWEAFIEGVKAGEFDPV